MAKRITTRSAKNKGARFQKYVAARVSDLLNMPYGKDECIQSRIMGGTSVDIVLIGPARIEFPWSCECKADESFNLKSWIRQASTNILEHTQWIVLFKKNRFKPAVCFDIEVFNRLFSESGLQLIEYAAKNWFLEKYIDTARVGGTDWYLKLKYEDTYVVVMDLDKFFDLMCERESSIKGVAEL